MPRRRTKQYVIPPLHFVMILAAFILVVICLLLYNFAPSDKAGLYATTITTLIGFLVGKFSNQFGKPILQQPPVEQEQVTDEETGG